MEPITEEPDPSDLSVENVRLYVEEKISIARVSFKKGHLKATCNRYNEARLRLEIAQPSWNQDGLDYAAVTFKILYKNLALCYLKMGLLDNADRLIKRLDGLKADDTKTLYLRANLYYRQGKYMEARNVVRKALEIAPKNTDFLALLKSIETGQMEYTREFDEQVQRMFSAKCDHPETGTVDIELKQKMQEITDAYKAHVDKIFQSMIKGEIFEYRVEKATLSVAELQYLEKTADKLGALFVPFEYDKDSLCYAKVVFQ